MEKFRDRIKVKSGGGMMGIFFFFLNLNLFLRDHKSRINF
jgi:hypothetical protein